MDYIIPPDTVVNDAVLVMAPTNLWHLPTERWKPVWERVTGQGVKVAVLDTGYTSHPDCVNPVASKSFVSGQQVRDGNGHGSHCAGTAVGRNGIGVAPGADLLVGKVLSDQGSGGSGGIAAGVRWAADQGADVISMSLGGGGPDQETNSAIDYAFSKGAIVNAAAGNSGYNGSNTIGWPAKYLGCLCCAAYRSDGQIANFSSGGREIDWACPGQDIVSISNTGSGYRSMSGTSMATPFGSGVLALIIELMRREGNSRWTSADAVCKFFELNCEDAGQPGQDFRFGWGKPLIEKIVEGLINDSIIWL